MGHFAIVLCSSHISMIRHLIVLLNRDMTLTVSESSFDLYHLHFIPLEKHNKHTLPPFPPCLQHLAVTRVSPLHLLLLHSVAVCSHCTFKHPWFTGKLYHNDGICFVMWPKEEPSGVWTDQYWQTGLSGKILLWDHWLKNKAIKLNRWGKRCPFRFVSWFFFL